MVLQAQQHEAHVHGIATLSMAFEDTTLEMQFESPAANLLGFEHQAKDSEEKQLVEAMASTLRAPDKLFTFAGTKCVTTDVSLNTEDLIADEQEHKREHEHHHDHEHDHHHHHGSQPDLTPEDMLAVQQEFLDSVRVIQRAVSQLK